MGTIERHAWNQGFEWQDHAGPFRRLTADQASQFDTEGFVVIEGLLGAEELARTVAEIDAFEAVTDQRLQGLEGGREVISEAGAITFTTHLVTKSPWLRDVVANATFADLCADLVGPDVRLYWDQAVYKKPEKPRRFPWHQDNGYTFVEPQAYLTCWIALTDATVENGCPQVVPGLHRSGTLRHRWVDPLGFECFPDHPTTTAAEVPAGGAVLFSSLTPHLTGPNTTDAVRKAYIVQYAPDGAATCQGSPGQPPVSRNACDAPDRQFSVLVGGQRPA
ncbi:MAG: phytanoyl-CoA dioxygenase family protein [Actinomycetota bacterium]|nr:phytanoyl-CoA dioxygenase family protein [Actinomycetota bacterium]